ncbi:hypothetical protein ZWY2020_046072, partial [Hordeum vulgare]
ESISPLAKPFITLPLDSDFVCTQSTEPPTYVATHQIWCFSIPSYGEQRRKYNRILHLSGSRFSLFLLLTPPRLVPNVWHFPYFVGATSTNSLMIKLQPKIYDYIMLTVRILFIPSVCSCARNCDLFAVTKAALSTPQISAKPSPFLIYPIIEFAIFVALIVQVREEGWTSRMRESGSIEKKEE